MDKTFDEVIAGVRTAERGVDVREDIAQGMEYVKQYAKEVTDQQQAALQAAQTATGAASTATEKAASAAKSASAANASASAANTSETNAKKHEEQSAANLNATKEYFEQVRTITIGAQGWYATQEALAAAVPVGENGWWAVVGTTDTIWTWDSDTNTWKDSVQRADFSDYYTREQMDALLKAQRLKDHPVGSAFFTIWDDDPAELFGGNWVKIAENLVIMGASSAHAAGTTVEAGLPNITGTVTNFAKEFSGAFTQGALVDNKLSSGNGINRYTMNFDASLSNPIYGASDTVQPAAYYMNIWLRIP